jgi:hypothetical protein
VASHDLYSDRAAIIIVNLCELALPVRFEFAGAEELRAIVCSTRRRARYYTPCN